MGEAEKPDYVPSHKLPAWISSADIHAAIRQLADDGVEKAACWDFTQAVYRLTDAAHTARATLERAQAEGEGK